MKVGIIGAGAVGAACAKAMLLRGSCHEIVLLDVNQRRAKGLAADLSHGGVLCPPTLIRAGDYRELDGAAIVIITAGVNEKTGGAIDPKDKRGRLLLLPENARIYGEIVPRLKASAPDAVMLVVTDPPDPLADVVRRLTKARTEAARNRIISTGTFLDTLRFRLQLARRLKCHPSSVEALVVGEHGTSQVYVWSSARIGGVPLSELVREYVGGRGWSEEEFRSRVEKAVKFANIDIIKGTGASQHGIGIVTARLVEAVLRDEGLVAPVGVFQPQFSVTLSLPALIGRRGVSKVLTPTLSAEETRALAKSAEAIAEALAELD
jgi:L-lactate dehydrogenase